MFRICIIQIGSRRCYPIKSALRRPPQASSKTGWVRPSVIEEDMWTHRSTSCSLPHAGLVRTIHPSFEREQRLLDLIKARGAAVLRHALVGGLIDQEFDPGPV